MRSTSIFEPLRIVLMTTNRVVGAWPRSKPWTCSWHQRWDRRREALRLTFLSRSDGGGLRETGMAGRGLWPRIVTLSI